MTTCKVVVEIQIDGKPIMAKRWPSLDVMKLAVARGWGRRKFNTYLKAQTNTEQVVVCCLQANYGPPYHTVLTGTLSGVRGKLMASRGVYEK